MMTFEQRHILIDALHREAARHRVVADEYVKNQDIFAARMAACHVLGSLASVLLSLSQEAVDETPSA